jgi:hypothetical protein
MILAEKSEGKRSHWTRRHRRKTLKSTLKKRNKRDEKASSGFVWLRIRISDRLW